MCKNLSPAILAILARETAANNNRDAILAEIDRLNAEIVDLEDNCFAATGDHDLSKFDARRNAGANIVAVDAAQKAQEAVIVAEYDAMIAPVKRQIRRLQVAWIWSF
jgi:hypothetical protein